MWVFWALLIFCGTPHEKQIALTFLFLISKFHVLVFESSVV